MDVGAKILFPVAESETLSVQTRFWMYFSKDQLTVFQNTKQWSPTGICTQALCLYFADTWLFTRFRKSRSLSIVQPEWYYSLIRMKYREEVEQVLSWSVDNTQSHTVETLLNLFWVCASVYIPVGRVSTTKFMGISLDTPLCLNTVHAGKKSKLKIHFPRKVKWNAF